MPELARENRADGDSCCSCHGGGKVPSMSLEAPDRRSRYLSPQDTWTNYRTLLARIDKANPAVSKVLRKPLNIQTGKEDGHQGECAISLATAATRFSSAGSWMPHNFNRGASRGFRESRQECHVLYNCIDSRGPIRAMSQSLKAT